VGDQHPISAYALAYMAYEQGDVVQAEKMFRAAAAFGYPVAQTDLGKLLYETGRQSEGVAELALSAAAGDPEANYVLGELAAKANQLQEALEFLRKASGPWTRRSGRLGSADRGLHASKQHR
jgi:TPR repeat protein